MSTICYRIRHTEINGKKRPLTIYSAEAMKEQKIMYEYHKELFMENTHSSVYSFIPGFSNFDAAALAFHEAQHFQYYIKLDIHEYYPSIDRQLLLENLSEMLPSNEALHICQYVFCCPKGIAEGSPLSPAVSNMYLRFFDAEMSSIPDSRFIRYCDDILFLTDVYPEMMIFFITNALASYSLRINEEKLLKGSTSDGFNYIGYNINPVGLSITYEKLAEILYRLRVEKNEAKRIRIANGFKAYYRFSVCLPQCDQSLEFLTHYGSDDEIRLFLNYGKEMGDYNEKDCLYL